MTETERSVPPGPRAVPVVAARRLSRIRIVQLPTRAARLLGLMALIDSLGTGLFLAGSALFLTRAVGLSARQVGFGLSIGAVVTLLCTVPCGRLADRYGPQPVLVALNLWRAVAFVGYAFVGSFATFLVAACFVAAPERAIAPIIQSLVGSAVATDDRVVTMASLRVIRNAGYSLSAGFAALALQADTRWAYQILILVNALSFVGAAAVVKVIEVAPAASAAAPASYGQTPGGTPVAPVVPRRAGSIVARDPRYVVLTLLNGLLIVHLTLLSIGFPIWLSQHTSAPVALMSPLLLLNTLLVVALQVRATAGTRDVATGASALRRASIALAAGCLLIAVSAWFGTGGAVVALVLAMTAVTVSELWQSAAEWSISYDLAPAARRGEYLAFFALGRPLQGIAGPALVGGVVIGAGTRGWLLLAVALVCCGWVGSVVAKGARPPSDAP
jgi:MFS family permease